MHGIEHWGDMGRFHGRLGQGIGGGGGLWRGVRVRSSGGVVLRLCVRGGACSGRQGVLWRAGHGQAGVQLVQGLHHLRVGAAQKASRELVQQAAHFVAGVLAALPLGRAGLCRHALQAALQQVRQRCDFGAARGPGQVGQGLGQGVGVGVQRAGRVGAPGGDAGFQFL